MESVWQQSICGIYFKIFLICGGYMEKIWKVSHFFVGAFIILVLISPVQSIAVENLSGDSKQQSLQPGVLKIGLLSDSHFQTTKSTRKVKYQKGKFEDTIVESALRPAALNYLSKYLLRYFLMKLKAEVDLIIYLGDGANNGCKDEVDGIIEELIEFRKREKLPVFYVIGNHDYLGAGNTALMDERIQLCNESLPDIKDIQNKDIQSIEGVNLIDKYRLIEMASNFNRGNNEIFGLKALYVDNFSEDKNKVKGACYLGAQDQQQHKKEGCFLVGKVIYKNSEILFMDSSDYAGFKTFDTFFRDVLDTEYYGAVGFISNKQIEWIEQKINSNPKSPDYRIVATHYYNNYELFGKKLIHRICDANLPKPNFSNYWFSAHTHVEEPKAEIVKCKNGIGVESLNIGSTMANKPHAVVVTLEGKKPIKESKKMIQVNEDVCASIVDAMKCEPIAGSPEYIPITIEKFEKDKTNGLVLFGIGKEYRKAKWSETQDKLALFNLLKFIDYIGKDPGRGRIIGVSDEDKETIISACIAAKSAQLESSKDRCVNYDALLGCLAYETIVEQCNGETTSK